MSAEDLLARGFDAAQESAATTTPRVSPPDGDALWRRVSYMVEADLASKAWPRFRLFRRRGGAN